MIIIKMLKIVTHKLFICLHDKWTSNFTSHAIWFKLWSHCVSYQVEYCLLLTATNSLISFACALVARSSNSKIISWSQVFLQRFNMTQKKCMYRSNLFLCQRFEIKKKKRGFNMFIDKTAQFIQQIVLKGTF